MEWQQCHFNNHVVYYSWIDIRTETKPLPCLLAQEADSQHDPSCRHWFSVNVAARHDERDFLSSSNSVVLIIIV